MLIERISQWAEKSPTLFRYSVDAFLFVNPFIAGLVAAGETGVDSLSRAWALIPLFLTGTAVVVRDKVVGISERAQKLFVARLLRIARLAVAKPRRLKPGLKALRICLMRPVPGSKRDLKVWLAENMDGDQDGSLVLEQGTGVAGWVYTHQQPAWVDRVAYPDDGRFTILPSHSGAAVRTQARSFYCIPVYDPHTAALPQGQRTVVAILCCDSDLPLEETGFTKPHVVSLLTNIADFVAASLVQP